MRIRTIKPEFWKNEAVAKLPEFTRLLAIALLNYADDEGYFPASIALIRGELFPFTEDSVSIQCALSELSRIGYIRTGTAADGRVYGFIVNFEKHQRINRKNPSRIKDLAIFSDSSLSAHTPLTEHSHPELEQGIGIGTGNKEGGNAAVAASTVTDEEWLSQLSASPAYSGIDVPREYAKMQTWCTTNRKLPTRRRFINWLNRVEKPMQGEFGKPLMR